MNDLDLDQIQKWIDGGCKEAWRGGVGKFQHVAEIYIRQLFDEVRRLRVHNRQLGGGCDEARTLLRNDGETIIKLTKRADAAEKELSAANLTVETLQKENAELVKELADYKATHLCLRRQEVEEIPNGLHLVITEHGDLDFFLYPDCKTTRAFVKARGVYGPIELQEVSE